MAEAQTNRPAVVLRDGVASASTVAEKPGTSASQWVKIATPLLLLAVVLVAIFFRFWHLAAVPPGLFGDEATDGLDALDVLAGRGAVFFPANFGREGLHIWIVAGMFRLMGITPLAIRLPSAVAGILTVLATYWLGLELLRALPALASVPASGRDELRADSNPPFSSFARRLLPFLPAIAATYLATSYFHVHYSRFGVRGVFTPLCGALAFAAFWHAFNLGTRAHPERFRGRASADLGSSGTLAPFAPEAFQPSPMPSGWLQRGLTNRYLWYALSGLFLGLSLHFYTASRFYPVFLVGFLLLDLAFCLPRGRWRSAILVRDRWPLAVLFLVLLLVFAPLGWYFLQHPGSFGQRAAEVSAFRGASPGARILRSAAANLLQFFVPGRGDQAQFYNLPGRAVFDPVTAVLALLGIGVLLALARRRPALFLLLWFPALLLPSFLATDRAPTLPRVLGTLPGVCFFPAVGLIAVLALVWRLLSRSRVPESAVRLLLAGIAGLALLVQGGLTYRDYFQVWGPAPATQDAFEVDMSQAAAWLAQNRPSEHVYLSSDIYRHPTFMLLHEHATVKTYFDQVDPSLSWFDARSALPLPPTGSPAVYLLPISARPAASGLDLLRAAGAMPLAQPAGGDQPDQLQALSIPGRAAVVPAGSARERFTDRLTLLEARWAGGALSAPVLQLTWQTAGPDPAGWPGYRLQVSGQTPSGTTWQQDLPFDDFRPPEWVPDGRFVTWRDLKLPSTGEPLPTSIQLRLLAADTAQPLTTADAPDGWHQVPVTANSP